MLRTVLSATVVAASLIVSATSAQAQDRTTRMLVGFPPGVGLDILARVLADHMRTTLGRQVIVENKPGAGGIVANEAVKMATPDGSTLLITPFATMVAYPHSYSKLPYDVFADYAPVAHVANIQLGFAVSTKIPAKSLAEYITYAKAGGMNANVGSPGAGSLPHFFGVMFGRAAGFDTVHVPYRGSGPVLAALQSGEVPAGVLPIGDFGAFAEAGHVRILATSGPTRDVSFPQVPTFKESGLPIEGVTWFAMFAPAKTPADTVAAISRSVLTALKDPEVLTKLKPLGMEITGLGPADLARIHKADYEKWGPPIKASGFKADQ